MNEAVLTTKDDDEEQEQALPFYLKFGDAPDLKKFLNFCQKYNFEH